MSDITLNTFLSSKFDATDLALTVEEIGAQETQSAQSKNKVEPGQKPLTERVIKQIKPDGDLAAQNAEMRKTLADVCQKFMSERKVNASDMKSVMDAVRKRLGVDVEDSEASKTVLTPLEARRIATYVRAQTNVTAELLDDAVSAADLPKMVKDALVTFMKEQANHPDVLNFLDTYQNGERNIDHLSRVAALLVQTKGAELDDYTRNFLTGFACGLKPTADISDATKTSLDTVLPESPKDEEIQKNGQDASERTRVEDAKFAVKDYVRILVENGVTEFGKMLRFGIDYNVSKLTDRFLGALNDIADKIKDHEEALKNPDDEAHKDKNHLSVVKQLKAEMDVVNKKYTDWINKQYKDLSAHFVNKDENEIRALKNEFVKHLQDEGVKVGDNIIDRCIKNPLAMNANPKTQKDENRKDDTTGQLGNALGNPSAQNEEMARQGGKLKDGNAKERMETQKKVANLVDYQNVMTTCKTYVEQSLPKVTTAWLKDALAEMVKGADEVLKNVFGKTTFGSLKLSDDKLKQYLGTSLRSLKRELNNDITSMADKKSEADIKRFVDTKVEGYSKWLVKGLLLAHDALSQIDKKHKDTARDYFLANLANATTKDEVCSRVFDSQKTGVTLKQTSRSEVRFASLSPVYGKIEEDFLDALEKKNLSQDEVHQLQQHFCEKLKQSFSSDLEGKNWTLDKNFSDKVNDKAVEIKDTILTWVGDQESVLDLALNNMFGKDLDHEQLANFKGALDDIRKEVYDKSDNIDKPNVTQDLLELHAIELKLRIGLPITDKVQSALKGHIIQTVRPYERSLETYKSMLDTEAFERLTTHLSTLLIAEVENVYGNAEKIKSASNKIPDDGKSTSEKVIAEGKKQIEARFEVYKTWLEGQLKVLWDKVDEVKQQRTDKNQESTGNALNEIDKSKAEVLKAFCTKLPSAKNEKPLFGETFIRDEKGVVTAQDNVAEQYKNLMEDVLKDFGTNLEPGLGEGPIKRLREELATSMPLKYEALAKKLPESTGLKGDVALEMIKVFLDTKINDIIETTCQNQKSVEEAGKKATTQVNGFPCEKAKVYVESLIDNELAGFNTWFTDTCSTLDAFMKDRQGGELNPQDANTNKSSPETFRKDFWGRMKEAGQSQDFTRVNVAQVLQEMDTAHAAKLQNAFTAERQSRFDEAFKDFSQQVKDKIRNVLENRSILNNVKVLADSPVIKEVDAFMQFLLSDVVEDNKTFPKESTPTAQARAKYLDQAVDQMKERVDQMLAKLEDFSVALQNVCTSDASGTRTNAYVELAEKALAGWFSSDNLQLLLGSKEKGPHLADVASWTLAMPAPNTDPVGQQEGNPRVNNVEDFFNAHLATVRQSLDLMVGGLGSIFGTEDSQGKPKIDVSALALKEAEIRTRVAGELESKIAALKDSGGDDDGALALELRKAHCQAYALDVNDLYRPLRDALLTFRQNNADALKSDDQTTRKNLEEMLKECVERAQTNLKDELGRTPWTLPAGQTWPNFLAGIANEDVLMTAFGSNVKDYRQYASVLRRNLVDHFMQENNPSANLGLNGLMDENAARAQIKEMFLQVLQGESSEQVDLGLRDQVLARNFQFARDNVKRLLAAAGLEKDKLLSAYIEKQFKGASLPPAFKAAMENTPACLTFMAPPSVEMLVDAVKAYAKAVEARVKGFTVFTQVDSQNKRKALPSQAVQITGPAPFQFQRQHDYMASVINGLAVTPEGTEYLKSLLPPPKGEAAQQFVSFMVDGTMTAVDLVPKNGPQGTNALEEHIVERINVNRPEGKQMTLGMNGTPEDAASVLGLVPQGKAISVTGGGKTQRLDTLNVLWENAAEALSKKSVCVLSLSNSQGTANTYVTITAATSRQDGKVRSFTYVNASGEVKEATLADFENGTVRNGLVKEQSPSGRGTLALSVFVPREENEHFIEAKQTVAQQAEEEKSREEFVHQMLGGEGKTGKAFVLQTIEGFNVIGHMPKDEAQAQKAGELFGLIHDFMYSDAFESYQIEGYQEVFKGLEKPFRDNLMAELAKRIMQDAATFKVTVSAGGTEAKQSSKDITLFNYLSDVGIPASGVLFGVRPEVNGIAPEAVVRMKELVKASYEAVQLRARREELLTALEKNPTQVTEQERKEANRYIGSMPDADFKNLLLSVQNDIRAVVNLNSEGVTKLLSAVKTRQQRAAFVDRTLEALKTTESWKNADTAAFTDLKTALAYLYDFVNLEGFKGLTDSKNKNLSVFANPSLDAMDVTLRGDFIRRYACALFENPGGVDDWLELAQNGPGNAPANILQGLKEIENDTRLGDTLIECLTNAKNAFMKDYVTRHVLDAFDTSRDEFAALGSRENLERVLNGATTLELNELMKTAKFTVPYAANADVSGNAKAASDLVAYYLDKVALSGYENIGPKSTQNVHVKPGGPETDADLVEGMVFTQTKAEKKTDFMLGFLNGLMASQPGLDAFKEHVKVGTDQKLQISIDSISDTDKKKTETKSLEQPQGDDVGISSFEYTLYNMLRESNNSLDEAVKIPISSLDEVGDIGDVAKAFGYEQNREFSPIDVTMVAPGAEGRQSFLRRIANTLSQNGVCILYQGELTEQGAPTGTKGRYYAITGIRVANGKIMLQMRNSSVKDTKDAAVTEKDVDTVLNSIDEDQSVKLYSFFQKGFVPKPEPSPETKITSGSNTQNAHRKEMDPPVMRMGDASYGGSKKDETWTDLTQDLGVRFNLLDTPPKSEEFKIFKNKSITLDNLFRWVADGKVTRAILGLKEGDALGEYNKEFVNEVQQRLVLGFLKHKTNDLEDAFGILGNMGTDEVGRHLVAFFRSAIMTGGGEVAEISFNKNKGVNNQHVNERRPRYRVYDGDLRLIAFRRQNFKRIQNSLEEMLKRQKVNPILMNGGKPIKKKGLFSFGKVPDGSLDKAVMNRIRDDFKNGNWPDALRAAMMGDIDWTKSDWTNPVDQTFINKAFAAYVENTVVRVKGYYGDVPGEGNVPQPSISKKHGPDINKDISQNVVFTQGSNTCFMMSLVNGLCATKAGTSFVKNRFKTRDNKMVLAFMGKNNKFSQTTTVATVKQEGNEGASLKESNQVSITHETIPEDQRDFSWFEIAFYNAYKQRYEDDSLNKNTSVSKLGEMGELMYAASAIGFDIDETLRPSKLGIDHQKAMDTIWSKVAGALFEGGLCVLGGRDDENKGFAHFVAVTRAYIDDKGNKVFEIRDSLSNGSVTTMNFDQLQKAYGPNIAFSTFKASKFNDEYLKELKPNKMDVLGQEK